jgi:hypothetical protein
VADVVQADLNVHGARFALGNNKAKMVDRKILKYDDVCPKRRGIIHASLNNNQILQNIN